MMRLIIFASLFVLVAPLAVPAQQISIGFGRRGVEVHADFGRAPHGHGIRHRHGPRPVLRTPLPGHGLVGGHWELRRERVWIEGCERIVHVPAEYAWRRDSCGHVTRVCVRPAYDRIVCEPGRWEWRERRVWVTGC